MDKNIEISGKIKSREDFIEFMKLLASTVADPSVRYYPEAITAWTRDMDGYYGNIGKAVPTDIKWDFIAALIRPGLLKEGQSSKKNLKVNRASRFIFAGIPQSPRAMNT